MKKKIYITDINSLSQVFLETLKEVSKSGNVLNSTTLSQFLARKQIIKDLLKLASEAREEGIKVQKKAELNIEAQKQITYRTFSRLFINP